MLLFLLFSCAKPDVDTAIIDADGDGHAPYDAYGDDCDDDDPAIHAGADELCDGLDQDCDLRIDEDPSDAPTVWLDEDFDGFGDGEPEVRGCEVEAGWATRDGDCYDNAILGGDVNPSAEEVGFNNRDDDCNPDTPDTCGDTPPDPVTLTLTPLEEHSFGGYLFPAVEIYVEFHDADGDLGTGAQLDLWWGRVDQGGPDTTAPPPTSIGGGSPSEGCNTDTSRNTVYLQVGPYVDPDTEYTFAARLTDKSGASSTIYTADVLTPQ